ncbi:aminopeptidase C [Candidatus Uabimicrobium amorphum]|uniref:Aminopeptidase n=1 Tax=Uabimicrobium amorphum TaxID=2596890 RepID=A0A5S9ISG0_UABAM|nr:C1 family peptidase [Candidatus Uabimicrobium amorphum]BBM87269.1 aminopeptidase [Candidatus Uabimicrobium amorphum]
MKNLILILSLLTIFLYADDVKGKKEKKLPEFKFTVIKKVATTPVKNQSRTGTCWSFGSSSFLESELIRRGKGKHDLSEMFVVRHTYPRKARNYVRRHGKTNLGAGSLAQDAIYVAHHHGVVPEEVYSGLFVGQSKHNHREMDAILKGILDSIIKQDKLSKVWPQAIAALLDVYLGKVPQTFNYQGQQYTAKSLAKELEINANDYVELTSFSHHPYYRPFSIEIPDNWANNISHNLPLEEFIATMDHALTNGYSLVWDGDVSERSFSNKKGVATLPLKEWNDRSDKEKKQLCNTPEAEKEIDQAARQEAFDNYTSTDDHLMHVTGIAKDQNGTRYYITKNSWGTKKCKMKGYVYMSEAYVRSKTISILLHKDAIPANIASKLGITK